MKIKRSVPSMLYKTITTVMFILGCYCSGYAMPVNNIVYEGESLSTRDSIIQEMVGFIKPGTKLTKTERKHIENRIKNFPQKILRRDTISYFINTAYALSYYEFYRHDYKKAKKWQILFEKNVTFQNILTYFFRFSAVAWNAKNSLREKGNFKIKKDKNSWYVITKIQFADSLKFDPKRTHIQFIDSFLDEMPIDCASATYLKLLKQFKEGEGRLELLNGCFHKGFVERCVDANRKDILKIIYSLWNVDLNDFYIGSWGYLEFRNKTIKVDSAAISQLKEGILSFNPINNRSQIDSLINSNLEANLSSKILQLMNSYLAQSRFKDIINACQDYGPYVNINNLSTLHNFWGLALTNLGQYNDALIHFDTAISLSSSPDSKSITRLNKACTLGEMEKTNDAIAIFREEKNTKKSAFDKFCWNDNLGYVYSFKDPKMALYYYNEAEKYLDSGTLYADRKVRHFCRKARMLESDKHLQKLEITKAINLIPFCSDITKGVVYTELGIFYLSSFDYREADKNFSIAYNYFAKLSPEDMRISYLNRHYATNLCKLNNPTEAVGILIRQVELQESLYGKEHSEYFKSLRQLLQISCEYLIPGIPVDRLYQEFKQLYSKSNEYYENVMTEITYLSFKNNRKAALLALNEALSHPMNPMQKLNIYQQFESVLRNQDNSKNYAQNISTLIPRIKTDIYNSLLLLSGDDRGAIQNPLSNILNGTILKKDYYNALQISLFRKGLLFTTKKVIEKELEHNIQTRKRYRDLTAKREELNFYISYNDTLHIPALAVSVDSLERELNRHMVNNKKIFRSIDKSLSQVCSSLNSNDLAIEFVKYSDNEEKYGAFLIDKHGLSKFIKIGTCNEIHDNPSMIWNPIVNQRSNYDNIYFCTDGILNNIEIESIPFLDDMPIFMKYNLHRVFHLADIKPDGGIGKNVVAVGVSDHNSPIGEGETMDRGNWTDLPEVKYELELIKSRLPEQSTTIIFNDDAREKSIKDLSNSNVSTLHFSTHGFYRNSDSLIEAASDSLNFDFNIARRALSAKKTDLSGLVLRQGNISWKAPQILDEEDDLLTSDEIETMNFPDLNLTVLSACDTGLGSIDSDGVWGLQRAFRIAGSKSIICTLNKVNDYWTSQFMDLFYEHAAKGGSIYDSFQYAQKSLYKSEPDSPEIWSSFILIE